MTYDLNQIAPAFTHLDSNDVVITPNRRISAWLHRKVDLSKVPEASGMSVWESPIILPLSTWLDSLLEQARDAAATDIDSLDGQMSGQLLKLVLSSTQERTVWEDIITCHGGDWIKPDGAAKQAQQAWSVLNRWGEAENAELGDINENTHLFQQWLAAFCARCHENGWLSNAETPALINQCIEAGLVSTPKNLYFYGFDEIEPGTKQVVNAFVGKGCKYTLLEFAEMPNQSVRQGFSDKSGEIFAALTWLVASNATDPKGSYCIVAPDIADDRSLIERLCKRLVQPLTFTHPNDNAWRDSINVSAGTPLGSFGIVADALLLLKVLTKPITREEWGVLLRSPYWGASANGESFAWLSQISDKLAEAKNEKVTIEFVRKLIASRRTPPKAENSDVTKFSSDAQCAEKTDALTLLLDLISTTNVKGKKRFSDWAVSIPTLLEGLGWPGGRSLTSQDYQLREKFLEQVSGLKYFDEVAEEPLFFDAVRRLQSALSETMFQIKTEQAPMQVLGVLEASGLHFDGIWVLSADDQHWPASPSPNPFISPQLQRSRGMPNASAEKELAYAKFILSSFSKTSSITIFSWHEFEGDSELNPSPILEEFETGEQLLENVISATAMRDQKFSLPVVGNVLIDLHDDKGTALAEGVKVKGGASIVKTQALCPFKAFAEYRLRAKPSDQAEEGLSPAERGELVHKSLELFWKECSTSLRLLELLKNEELLQKTISTCVNNAMEEFTAVHSGVNEAFLSLEILRLESLVFTWLENIESKRTPFSVSSVEQTENLQISNLEISVKADRIDLIDGSHTVIIDYKTGQKSRAAWEGERPDDPQLPLYAVSHKDAITGIVFGIVKKGESSIKGEVDEMVDIFNEKDSRSIGKIEDWPKHVENWEAVLTNLATDFCEGVAAVDPKNKLSCQYCELTPFCRRKEI